MEILERLHTLVYHGAPQCPSGLSKGSFGGVWMDGGEDSCRRHRDWVVVRGRNRARKALALRWDVLEYK